MRVAFLDIIKEEHKKGKTIFMSSHLFEEMEKTCDRVALINDGHLVDVVDMNDIRNRSSRDFKIEFNNTEDFEKFKKMDFNIIRVQQQYNQVTINIDNNQINDLFKSLKNFKVKFISEVKYSLEKYFKTVLNNQTKEVDNV